MALLQLTLEYDRRIIEIRQRCAPTSIRPLRQQDACPPVKIEMDALTRIIIRHIRRHYIRVGRGGLLRLGNGHGFTVRSWG
ncbi:hypothetical protein ASAP_0953 [Asaia bogorensis]|uniref:Uncharacterized protein n=1 Tax=Asaia bogorensis TaxID=91915 RepID=A0A060QE65_9PROT|nr:hypothetical protein ASAP_0953 [Asaia bogorensis]